MVGPLRDLLNHQAWADAMFFRAWLKSGAAEDEELRARADHWIAVQEAFLQVLKGDPVTPTDHPLPDLPPLKARCEAAHGAFQVLGQGLDEAALARTVRVPWFPEPPCVISVSDALLQVCLHTQHHRGQNMARIKALGAAPKNVDYIIWLWKQKPEVQWP